MGVRSCINTYVLMQDLTPQKIMAHWVQVLRDINSVKHVCHGDLAVDAGQFQCV